MPFFGVFFALLYPKGAKRFLIITIRQPSQGTRRNQPAETQSSFGDNDNGTRALLQSLLVPCCAGDIIDHTQVYDLHSQIDMPSTAIECIFIEHEFVRGPKTIGLAGSRAPDAAYYSCKCHRD